MSLVHLAKKLSKNKVSVDLNFTPSVPNFIWADPIRLKQILINIVGNAIKFLEAGSVNVHVLHREASPQSGSFLDFVVTDTGRGIGADQQPELFKLFGQGNIATSQFGGTGLGLVISRKLAELLGGSVQLTQSTKSTIGYGSTFTVTIRSL